MKNNLTFRYVLLLSIFNISCILGRTLLHSADDKTMTNRFSDQIRRYNQNAIDKVAEKLRIRVYKGPAIDEATILDLRVDQPKIIFQNIDPSKPLVIYIHGFLERASNKAVKTVVGAYLKRGKDNILLLDWSDLAFENYIKVVKNSRLIASVLAETFDQIVDLGLDLEKFHLVGHSLGGQIAGYFGKVSRYSIPRITGLDPAGPGFYGPADEHIDTESARFVDIIHTDGGFYGAYPNTGTVDFFANMGTRAQPGCSLFGLPLTPVDLCSHWRSWEYYAESIQSTHAFPATKCSSYIEFITGRCLNNEIIYAGEAALNNSYGSYFFTTNDKPPFGKGYKSPKYSV